MAIKGQPQEGGGNIRDIIADTLGCL